MTRAKDISKILTDADISGNIDVDGTTNLDVVDIDGAVNMATTALVTGVLTANGGAVFNEAGADVDFRVESDTGTHALFVDGATNAVSFQGDGTNQIINSPVPSKGAWTQYYKDMTPSFVGGIGTYSPQANASVAGLVFSTYTGSWLERMRIDSSGNVGIGTASPSQALVVSESSTPTIQIKDGAGSGTRVSGRLHIGEADNLGVSIENSTTSYNDNCAMVFKTSPAAGTITERMRIDSSGNLLLGTTNPVNGYGNNNAGVTLSSTRAQVFSNSAGDYGLVLNKTSYQSGSTCYQINFRTLNQSVGGIFTNNSATIYSTSSDYRLKENVVTDWDATTRLKQLKPSRFNFIADADTTVDGFLAHEVQAIVPEAISGTKDAVDADGNAVMQGIDQSKLVPLLVKTIQELEARITAGGL